jgi:hypothetical protein
VSLEHVSRDLLFPPVSIISAVLGTDLMLLVPEGQVDESLESFSTATLSEGIDKDGNEKCIRQQECGFGIIHGTIIRKGLSSVPFWICVRKFLTRY